MKKSLLMVMIIVLIVFGFFIYAYIIPTSTFSQKVLPMIGITIRVEKTKSINQNLENLNIPKIGEVSKFIFIKEYKVQEPNYDGGDFPNGNRITIFKKGDIVLGKYRLSGCSGKGCTSTKVVQIVNSPKRVDTKFLIPYN